MEIFSTATKLFVWRLKTKRAKRTVILLLTGWKKSVTHYKHMGLYWILCSQMTKTFRDNCDINLVQQTSCERLFPDVQTQWKMYFFALVYPRMDHNYGVIPGKYTCRDCVWPKIAGLYTTCHGERVLVVISGSSHQFSVTFLPLKPCLQKVQQHMVSRFDAVWFFIFLVILWTLQAHFTLWLSLGRCSVSLRTSADHYAFILHLALARVGL